MIKKQQIIECEKRLLAAFKNNDIEVVEELLHDNLLFNIPNGQTVTKEMDIANLRSGFIKIIEISTSEQQICITDNIATVAVTMHVRAKYEDNLMENKFRYLRVWKFDNDSWKVIAGSGFQI
jgi:ketosteroid isomerase-like protein